MHTGTISPASDFDTWTFSATTGDHIVVRVGEITQTGSFTPRIRLQNPSAVQIGVASGTVAGEISVTATNTGTFTVVVDDAAAAATGTYRLTLAKTPGTVFVAPGDEGGPLTNGVMHIGTIDVGDLDVWTFSAIAGENITLRMGELTNGSALTPALWLYGPNGALLEAYGSSSVASEVSVRATNSGTFTVVAGDFSSFYAGSGGYRLTLAKTGDAIVTSAGDEGGPLTNGVMHTGAIDVGDADIWSFTANTGDSIVVRMGELTNGSPLTPAIWLYGPSGALLGAFGSSSAAAEVAVRATNSGTFTVVVADFSSFYAGSGGYRLTLAKTGAGIITSAGDEGGPLTNGITHTGMIDVGDADIWNFSASAGDSIVLRMGELVNGSTLTPYLRLYGPDGALLDFYGSSVAASEVEFRATNSGTFTVVATDNSSFYAGSGGYRLSLSKTGEPIVVAPGDDGGPLTNGIMHFGNIDVGDADLWNFTANAGDAIVVRMGETASGSTLTPAIWLYGPDGALLAAYGSSVAAAEVTVRATNSGKFTVVASDFSSFYAGSGGYRLTLAKTGGAVFTSVGDEGGPLDGGLTREGTNDLGDLDLFYFTACAGDYLTVQLDELVGGSPLTPWIRLYGRDGVLIRSVSGASTTQTSVQATNSGMFLIVVSDLSSFYGGSGGYRLTVNGLSDGLKLCLPSIAGTNTLLRGIGGISNATYRLYTTTNITTPASLWTSIYTNQFDSFGTFSYTNLFSLSERERYFRLWQQ
jgi:hypothetical protein